jgi:hypothetical protein
MKHYKKTLFEMTPKCPFVCIIREHSNVIVFSYNTNKGTFWYHFEQGFLLVKFGDSGSRISEFGVWESGTSI